MAWATPVALARKEQVFPAALVIAAVKRALPIVGPMLLGDVRELSDAQAASLLAAFEGVPLHLLPADKRSGPGALLRVNCAGGG